jgi:CRP/FNR family transcriptional regulator, anaerobic regulatory protein
MSRRSAPAPTADVCDACSVREMSICRSMSEPEQRKLAEFGSVQRFDPGDTILREGDAAQHVYIITDGTLMMFKLLADGRRQVMGFFLRGDFIGLTAGSGYGFSLQALTHARVCRFPLAAFRRHLLQSPKLEEELLGRASDELVNARTHVTLLGRRTALERVTSFLLCLAERESRIGGSPGLVFLPMTRSDIADYLGLTLETVSRSLSTLRKRGLIQLLSHGVIRLVGPESLSQLAETG